MRSRGVAGGAGRRRAETIGAPLARSPRSRIGWWAALVLLVGCGGGETPTGPVEAQRITFDVATARLEALGASITVAAQALDGRGRPVPGAGITWTSADVAVATVAGGVVTAVGNGATIITASSGAARSTLGVTVQQVAAQLHLTSASDTLYAVGDSGRVRVEVRDARGGAMLADSAAVRFGSDTPDILAVDTTGVAVARAHGTGIVRATLGVVTAVHPVVVRPRAARLAVVRAPADAQAGVPLDTLVVDVLDARGTRVLNDDATAVTASLVDASTGAHAGGTVTVVAGRATFSTLVVGARADRYVLQFDAAGAAPARSDTLTLRAGAPAVLRARSDTSVTAPAGTALAPSLRVRVSDAWDNAVSGARVSFAVVTGDAQLADTSAHTDSLGDATLGVTLGRRAGVATVRARLATDSLQYRLTGTPNGVIAGVVRLDAAGAAAAGATSSPATRQAAVRGAAVREFSTRGGSTRGSLTRQTTTSETPTPESAADELLVVYHPSVHANATPLTAGTPAARRNAVAVRTVRDAMRSALELPTLREVVEPLGVSPLTLTSRVRVRPGVSRALAVQRLRADPRVRSVEPNARVHSLRAPTRSFARHVQEARHVAARGSISLERLARRWRFDVDEAFPLPGVYPDAAFFVEQSWHYNAARFPQAWTVSEGSAAVIVAVVDDGMRFDHPAIAAQLTTDGYDFVSERSVLRCVGGTVSNTGDGDGYDADPTIPESWQLAGNCLWQLEAEGAHGLHVATTISATANNAAGLVGGTAFTRIRPVRALGLADGTAYDVAQAILYAAGLPADDGAGGTVVPAGGAAHIINLSLGASTPTTVMQAAVEQAHAAGVLLVAASGNAGNTVRNYPAAYPEVLSVTAVDPMLQRAWYASYGTTVDIAAPGGDVSVNSTHGVRSAAWDFVTGGPTTGSWNGTSMAAPHVSAAAALLKAVEPALTASALRTRLLGAAIDLGAPGPDVQFGAGLLNVEGALLGAPTRALQVVLVDATTGAERGRVPADATGAYRFAGLPDGAYWVFAGTDERGDGRLGLPGRVWGAAGGGATPTTVVVDGADTYDATFTVTPTTEVEPNNTVAQANVLRPDGYVLGTISATNDADMFAFLVTEPGTYRLSVVGQIGACGFAREADGRLSLLDGAGQLLERSLNVDTNAGNRCASITRVLAPGTYRVVVEGSTVGTYLLRASARPAGP